MWELLTGEEPYAELHYGAIIGMAHSLRWYNPTIGESHTILVPELPATFSQVGS